MEQTLICPQCGKAMQLVYNSRGYVGEDPNTGTQAYTFTEQHYQCNCGYQLQKIKEELKGN